MKLSVESVWLQERKLNLAFFVLLKLHSELVLIITIRILKTGCKLEQFWGSSGVILE